MTVKELRYLVDNLDEYIRVPGGIERLKKTVLHLAVSGQLVPQDPSEGTGEELFRQIQAQKAKLIAEGKLKKQKPLPAITEAEIPFAIPKTWKWVRLGLIAQTLGGNAFKSSDFGEIGTRVVRISDFNEDGLTSHKVVRTKDSSIYDKYSLHDLDILMCMTGGTVGKMLYIKDLPERMLLNQRVAIIRSTTGGSDYINIVLNNEYIKRKISESKNSTNDNISMPDIQNFYIPLPPLAEQKRIVKKVDAIFALIDELAEKYRAEQAEREKLVASSLAQLARGNGALALTHLSEIIRTKADAAQLRKTILHLAVSGQLVSQDSSEGTGEELYQQIQSEKAKLIAAGKLKKHKHLPEVAEAEIPFAIPKTWKWVRLGGASTYQQRGKSPKYAVNSKFPVISQKCVRTNHIDWLAIKYITEDSVDKYENFRFLQKGDLLLNSTGTGTIGRVGIFIANPDYDKVVADSHVTVVRFSDQVNFRFAHACFNAPFIQDDVESKASGSTNQIEWNLLSIQNELVPLPPLAEQTRIVQKTTQLLDLIAKLEPHLEK